MRQTDRDTLIVSISDQFRSITSALHVAVVGLGFTNAVAITNVVTGVMQMKGRVQMFQQHHFCGQFSFVYEFKYIICDGTHFFNIL